MTAFRFPFADKSVAPSRAPSTKSAAGVPSLETIAQIHEQAADLEAAAEDYTYDYSEFGETREEVEAELGPARDILSECREIQAMTDAVQPQAEALYNAATDIPDLNYEIEQLTDSVAQLEARLASFA